MKIKQFIFSILLLIGLISLFSKPVTAQIKLPKYESYVNDFAGVLKDSEKYSLDQFLKQVERTTSAEIAIVIVNSLQRYSIERYSVELFKKWGIGKRNKDNGVLIVVSINDRKTRIEVGYGLEGALPDGLCGEIIRQGMIPYFKKNDYKHGLWIGSMNVAKIIAKEANVSLKLGNEEKHFTLNKANRPSIFKKLFPLLILMLIMGFRTGIFPYLFLGSMLGSRRSYWGGSSSSFGGSSFGGFGGGLSGGGGATGSW